MAKPQQQKKKMTRPSWFQKQIERGGQDFLLRKQPLDIQKETLNIIRDIVRGNITKKDFQYLFDLKVLSNMRISIFEKYVELHTVDSCMSYAMQMQGGVQYLESNYGVVPENLQKVFNNTRNSVIAYCAILQNLDSMIAFVQADYVKVEEEYERVFSSVQFQLARFKYII